MSPRNTPRLALMLALPIFLLAALLPLVMAASPAAATDDSNLAMDIIPSDFFPKNGDTVTYTMAMTSTSLSPMAQVVMTDVLLAGLDLVEGALQASAGQVTYDADTRTIRWQGSFAARGSAQVRYRAALTTDDPVYNTAFLRNPQTGDEVRATVAPLPTWNDPEWIMVESAFGADAMGGHGIAVDASGAPHTAYAGERGVAYAAWSEWGWAAEPITAMLKYKMAALALDGADKPLLAYWYNERSGPGYLVVVEQQTATAGCGASAEDAHTWNQAIVTQVDDLDHVTGLDLAVGADGVRHLVYGLNDQLFYLNDRDGAWSQPAAVGTCDPAGGFVLALDGGSAPHVACASATGVTLFSRGNDGAWTSEQVAGSGSHPGLAYAGDTAYVSFVAGSDLKLATRQTAWQVEQVATLPGPGAWSAVAVRGDHLAVAYAAQKAAGQYEVGLATRAAAAGGGERGGVPHRGPQRPADRLGRGWHRRRGE